MRSDGWDWGRGLWGERTAVVDGFRGGKLGTTAFGWGRRGESGFWLRSGQRFRRKRAENRLLKLLRAGVHAEKDVGEGVSVPEKSGTKFKKHLKIGL
jgi:hypothetical protein